MPPQRHGEPASHPGGGADWLHAGIALPDLASRAIPGVCAGPCRNGFRSIGLVLALIYSDWVWPSLPPVVHAVSVAGWPPITIAACLQVFVVGIAGDASPARIRRALRTASVMAVLALIAVTVLVTRSRLPMSSDDVYVLAEAVFTEGDPAAVTAVVISSAYVIFVAVQLAWHGFSTHRPHPGRGRSRADDGGVHLSDCCVRLRGYLAAAVARPRGHG